MGDMADDFRALRSWNKERKTERRNRNTDALDTAMRHPDKIDDSGSYIYHTAQGTVVYYPSTSTWQMRGKVFRGPVSRFLTWMDKQTGEENG